MSDRPHVLVVSRDDSVLDEVHARSEETGAEVRKVATAVDAVKALESGSLDLMLLQARVDEGAGLTLLGRARARHPAADILMVGPPVSARRRVDILAAGADDYLELPLSAGDVLDRIRQTLSARRVSGETGLLGRSPRMLQVFEIIRQVAATKITVLIMGESGTGKEVAARAIHHLSPRSGGPFVAVNCGAIPEGLLESELFGHERGAFTGAQERHRGRLEQASGGTIFLDEIGETPLAVQVKLLRALEDQAFYRVGGSQPVHSDVRVLAATNRNLEEAVAQGTFRRDLYFRLRVVTLVLPPLRERAEDIPLLVERFLAEAAAKHHARPKTVLPETLNLLARAQWPGNVRELRNLIESVSVLTRSDEIRPEDIEPHLTLRPEVHGNLPVSLRGTREEAEREILYRTLLALRADTAEVKSILLDALRGTPVEAEELDSSRTPPATLGETEDRLVEDALRRTGGHRRKAAQMLGISERTLYRRLSRKRPGESSEHP